MVIPESLTCFLVEEEPGSCEGGLKQRKATGSIRQLPLDDLPTLDEKAGEVTIAVRLSAVNYKDALAATGHPGVALTLPLVPGIDAVGEVLETRSNRFSVGQTVMVSGADFGTKAWGGWSTLARAPAKYCFHVPSGLSDRDSIILGTAGFTAAHSIEKLQHHGVIPEDGPVVVTGASGGVGSLAVCLLSKLRYHVIAVTGKADKAKWLLERGASEVISRQELNDQSSRPLLSAKFAGAIDTVGGNYLQTVLRSVQQGGCVTACGIVAGNELNTSLFPFILRGIALQGIDSANSSVKYRRQLWNKLATEWKLDDVESMATDVSLGDVRSSVASSLSGQIVGRHVVVIA